MKESKHKMKLYHGTNYSSAINIVNHGINLKYSKPYLDFGPGFYTTPSYDHAALAAIRTTQKYNAKNNKNEEPYIVEVDYKPISAMDLVIGSYPRHSERWGKFVLNETTDAVCIQYTRAQSGWKIRYLLWRNCGWQYN